MEVQFDYRNAKYQGEVDPSNGTRKGSGILIDDDLSFYASQWREGKLNGPTVIYISHGKYIYGEWMNNQPYGLNVFRIADTVIVGEFINGVLTKNVLVIFQKCNYVAIIHQEKGYGDWKVKQSGILKNYDDLLRYIDQAQIPMKPQYFSLTKYLTYISNNIICVTACRGSENCYFGFQEGLGIVFNPNNGVVSVGVHDNKKLVQFGGRYEIPSYGIEGNFQTNQIIKFTKQRPKNQIYSIFQKMHKRSLNFKNQYFDSKVKLLTNVEELVRAKIDQIINNKHENTFTAMDLNDSLDYHAQNLDELNRINQIREQVYQSVHIPMKKATSAYVEGSPIQNKNRKSLLIPKTPQKNYLLHAPPSPVLMKKSPLKNKQRERSRTPVKYLKDGNKSRMTSESNLSKQAPSRYKIADESPASIQIPTVVQDYRQNYKQTQNVRNKTKIKYLDEENEIVSPIEKMVPFQQKYRQHNKQLVIECPPVKNFDITQDMTLGIKQYKKQQEKSLAYEIDRQFYKKIENRAERRFQKSPIKSPNYQDLSERRKRLLKQFKNLNNSQLKEPQNYPSRDLKAKQSSNISRTYTQQKKYPSHQQNSPNQYQQQSPLARQKLFSYQSKNTEQDSQMMPLSLHNQNRPKIIPLTPQQKNGTGKFGFSYETPQKQAAKYNIPQLVSRAFDKKPSHKEEGNENMCRTPTSRTPTTRKTYKYYFDQ